VPELKVSIEERSIAVQLIFKQALDKGVREAWVEQLKRQIAHLHVRRVRQGLGPAGKLPPFTVRLRQGARPSKPKPMRCTVQWSRLWQRQASSPGIGCNPVLVLSIQRGQVRGAC
jgi:hypothetical protein